MRTNPTNPFKWLGRAMTVIAWMGIFLSGYPSAKAQQCSPCACEAGGDLTPPVLHGIPANLTILCGQIPPPPEIQGCGINPGDFRTQTQGGWGTACNGNNPGCYRDIHFATAFPGGLVIGCPAGFTLTLTSSAAVEAFLPCGGPAGPLTQNYTNPACIGNVLSGQLEAAMLSVGFDNADPNFSASPVPLGSLVLNSGPLAGLTISQIIAEANNAIGGCGSIYSFSELNSALDLFNQNFVDGTTNNGDFDLPGGGGGGGGGGGPVVYATDSCTACPTITFTETSTGSGCNQVITRTWTATDNCGNSVSASQTITVQDNTPPVLSGVPANIVVNCNNIPAPPTVSATDNCGPNPVVTMTQTSSGSGCNTVITRTWTATDNCGNTVTASQNISVQDNVAPVLSGVPANTSITCGNLPPAPTVTATDNCDPNPVVTMVQTSSGSGCNMVITRTWTATDNCGNTVSASQNISVQDNVAPVLSGVPANTSTTCGNLPPVPTVTATDNCDPNPVVTMTETSTGNGCNIVITRTWTATDNCGNSASASQIINTTNDNTPPVLSCASGNVILTCGPAPDPPSVTATDNCTANPTVSMTETTSGTACNQVITRTWTATDACGNTATATQTITIQDNVPPVLAGVPANISAGCGSIPPPPNVTATDNCDCHPVVSFSQTTTGKGCNQLVIRTWTATDNCGNTVSATQTISIFDNTPPVLIGVPGNLTLTCGPAPAAPVVTATDNCTANPAVTMTETTSGPACNRVITRTWTATDNCGNSVSACQTITIRDNVAPVAICRNITVALGSNGTAVIAAADINNGSHDNCTPQGSLILSLSQTIINCSAPCVTVTLTVTDLCGNSSSCTATVTVTGASPCVPTFVTCPTNISVPCPQTNGCYGTGANVTWTEPTATASSPCATNGCPPETFIAGFYYLGEYNGHRYYRSTTSSTSWNSARTAAINAGGYLASITSAGENTFLTNALADIDYWIGLNDIASEGSFAWANGEPVAYTRWAAVEPNDQPTTNSGCTGADHVAFDGGNGLWYDRGACQNYCYIMEVPCTASSCPVTVTRISGPAPGSFFTGGTTTTIVYVATTTGGATDTCSFTVTVGSCPLHYCVSQGNCSAYEWIRNVSFNNLNNWSGNDGGYRNFTQYSASVTRGGCYTMSLRPGFSGNALNEFWKVWIDYNRDGDFNDAGEMVFTANGFSTVSGTVCIPVNAIVGTTRMRVAMSYGCSPPGPCSSFSYGEVEDYSVNISTALLHAAENGQTESEAENVRQEEMGLNPDQGSRGEVTVESRVGLLKAYPVPVNSMLTLDFFSGREEPVTIEVMTLEGKIISTKAINALEGENTVELDFSSLSAGTYFVKVSASASEFVEKIVKQ